VKVNNDLLIVTAIIIITIISANLGIITYTIIDHSQLAYAHNFVPAIAASFLTKINQIRVQTQLIENNIPSNFSLARQHADIASQLFDDNTRDDLYYNAEGNNGLAKQVSDEIPLALSNLRKVVGTISPRSESLDVSKQPQQQQQQTVPDIAAKQIKEIINNINGILDKAVSVRIDRYDLTNSTLHALVLADITEKAYNDYSYAYGIKPIMFSGSSSSTMMMNMGSGMGMGTMGGDPMANNNDASNRTLVNITAYQQAQGLATRAQQIFNNDLKPRSSLNVSSSSSSSSNNKDAIATINKIESNLLQLKNAIDSKAPAMNVMKIVHGDIHPALLITYKLQLRR
jgi:hypothetical protein